MKRWAGIGTESKRTARIAEVVIVLLLWGLGWLAAWKVMSYATGQDPRIYLHYAEDIRTSGYSAAAIARCTNWVVPGYPLLLAITLDLLGIFAAYWINLPIYFICIILMVIVMRRLSSHWETGLVLLFFFWIVISGYPLNPHYLFLPFRGLIEWTWIFGALAMGIPAYNPVLSVKQRCVRAAMTSLWLAVGVLFRETVLFLILPFSLIGIYQGVRGRRSAWWVIAAQTAPLALAAMALISWRWFQQEPIFNLQAQMWLKGLMQGGFAKPFHLLLHDIVQMIYIELRWYGVLLLAAGTGWAMVRHDKTIGALWITSILFVLFYAFYKSHARYTLSAVGLLAVVAGWGLAVSLSYVVRTFRPRIRTGWYGVAATLLVAMVFHATARMTSWGPQVTRKDVLALQAHPVAKQTMVFIDREQRHLVDALLAFTEVQPKDPIYEESSITNYAGAWYLRPVSKEGTAKISQGVIDGDWLAYYFDLESKPEDRLFFGNQHYEWSRLAERTCHNKSFQVPITDASDGGVLWLDFQAGIDGKAMIQVSGASCTGDEYVMDRPEGLIPLWLSPSTTRGLNLKVNIDSSSPMPADMSPVFLPPGVSRWFIMEEGRLPSAVNWLGRGFENQSLASKHGAAWRERAVLRLPFLAGGASAGIQAEVTLRLLPRPPSAQDIHGLLEGGRRTTPVSIWQIPGGSVAKRVSWRGAVESEPQNLVLTADPWPADCWYLRLERIGVAFAPAR